MTYTAAEMLTLIASLGVLLTAAGAVIVNIIVALRTTAKVAAVEAKTDVLVSEVQAVHTVTNSGLSKVQGELATSNALNAQLVETIRDLRHEREKTSIAVAIATPAPRNSTRVSDAPTTTETLKAIETHTAKTAENTEPS